jgi:hypothetical protein
MDGMAHFRQPEQLAATVRAAKFPPAHTSATAVCKPKSNRLLPPAKTDTAERQD